MRLRRDTDWVSGVPRKKPIISSSISQHEKLSKKLLSRVFVQRVASIASFWGSLKRGLGIAEVPGGARAAQGLRSCDGTPWD